ncbi:MAG: SAM-dependent methyltransferase [Dehalococcoidia bacterium]|nr:SAM-dependent methyltransferase [Dehalococcoidia bacterium]
MLLFLGGLDMPRNYSSKKELPVALRFIIKPFQFIVFLIIQLPLLPLTIFGYIFIVVKAMIYTKKHGVSATATNPLSSRWFLHIFGLRRDEATVKLISSLPFMSGAGLWLMMGPAFIANRICGYLPGLARLPEPEKASLMSLVGCRTGFFDKMMEKNINSMDQVVFMGAGFDTRAFKYCKGKNIKVFELDKESTQNCKIEALKKAGIDYEWITFVPIDFNQESWVDKLIDYGFDTSKKAFFLWEGVTPYLEEESVNQTLKAVAKSSAKGSVITFDLYSRSVVAGTGEGSFIMKYYGKPLLKMSGEIWKFGIDTTKNPKENVETLLKEAGLALGEFRLMGKTTEKEKPFGGLVEAVKI